MYRNKRRENESWQLVAVSNSKGSQSSKKRSIYSCPSLLVLLLTSFSVQVPTTISSIFKLSLTPNTNPPKTNIASMIRHSILILTALAAAFSAAAPVEVGENANVTELSPRTGYWIYTYSGFPCDGPGNIQGPSDIPGICGGLPGWALVIPSASPCPSKLYWKSTTCQSTIYVL